MEGLILRDIALDVRVVKLLRLSINIECREKLIIRDYLRISILHALEILSNLRLWFKDLSLPFRVPLK